MSVFIILLLTFSPFIQLLLLLLSGSNMPLFSLEECRNYIDNYSERKVKWLEQIKEFGPSTEVCRHASRHEHFCSFCWSCLSRDNVEENFIDKFGSSRNFGKEQVLFSFKSVGHCPVVRRYSSRVDISLNEQVFFQPGEEKLVVIPMRVFVPYGAVVDLYLTEALANYSQGLDVIWKSEFFQFAVGEVNVKLKNVSSFKNFLLPRGSYPFFLSIKGSNSLVARRVFNWQMDCVEDMIGYLNYVEDCGVDVSKDHVEKDEPETLMEAAKRYVRVVDEETAGQGTELNWRCLELKGNKVLDYGSFVHCRKMAKGGIGGMKFLECEEELIMPELSPVAPPRRNRNVEGAQFFTFDKTPILNFGHDDGDDRSTVIANKGAATVFNVKKCRRQKSHKERCAAFAKKRENVVVEIDLFDSPKRVPGKCLLIS